MTSARDAVLRAFAVYEQEQRGRDYSLAHVGRVRTLLDRWPPSPAAEHPRIEAVWDGPFALPLPATADLPYVLLVFVASLDGKTALDDPQEIGAGETDWWLYSQAVRYAADAVAGGRETMCSGSPRLFSLYDPDLVAARMAWLGKPRHPWQVIITGSGEVDPDREFLLAVPEVPAVVITSTAGKERLAPALRDRPGKHVLAVGPSKRRLNFREALRILRTDFGVERLVLIGGTAVATAFLEAGLVDEVFLTRSPRLLGGRLSTFFEGRGFPPATAPIARLMSLKVGTPPWEDVLFERRLLRP
jgi:riboflavin biosynthesis pyrimidine reductase